MTTLKSLSSKKGKKGFTLTELAIVIAVIAILIAVLVPTFTSVITSARETAAAEDAKNAVTAYILDNIDNGETLPDGSIVEVKSGSYYYYFVIESGSAVNVDDATNSSDSLISSLASANGKTSQVNSTITSASSYNSTSGSYSAASWTDSTYSATFSATVTIYVFTEAESTGS